MSDDDNVIRPAAFTERPSAESEIARRAAEIYDEFKDRRDDMMVERIAQRVVELLREDLHSLLASHQVDMDASGTRARGRHRSVGAPASCPLQLLRSSVRAR